jgi:bifunctional pyridoxal-dependent enzyme with beta-cystathionase and maltose regulon repressor activities
VLRKAFAGWYNNYFRVALDYESEILPLMGSKEGIMHITMAFVNPGDEVLIPNPGYPTYSSVTSLAGGRIRYYELDEKNGWHPDLEALESSDLSRVKLMWINYPYAYRGGSPNCSTNWSFGLRHNILLCNDNPYSFILNREHFSIWLLILQGR